METYDVIVIGGGPAGSAAAITAARLGARVLFLERGHFPRHKVCGEFVSAESLDLLASLLDCSTAPTLQDAMRVGRGRLFVDDRVLESVIDPPGASIARWTLDSALWQAAQNAGVDARQQQIVQTITHNRHFVVSTKTDEFAARSVINASGRWSNLKNAHKEDNERWLGLKAHFLTPDPELSVDLYFFDGGYCGVQPVQVNGTHGIINVCVMVRAEAARSLPEAFARHPALRTRSANWQQRTEVVATSPLIFAAPQPEKDGVLLVGDAAGFIDPFVGDGISLALRSGTLAAQSLQPFLEGKEALEPAAQRYCRTYRQRFLPVFRNAARIRRLFAMPRPVRWALLHLFANTPRLIRHLVRRTR